MSALTLGDERTPLADVDVGERRVEHLAVAQPASSIASTMAPIPGPQRGQ